MEEQNKDTELSSSTSTLIWYHNPVLGVVKISILVTWQLSFYYPWKFISLTLLFTILLKEFYNKVTVTYKPSTFIIPDVFWVTQVAFEIFIGWTFFFNYPFNSPPTVRNNPANLSRVIQLVMFELTLCYNTLPSRDRVDVKALTFLA